MLATVVGHSCAYPWQLVSGMTKNMPIVEKCATFVFFANILPSATPDFPRRTTLGSYGGFPPHPRACVTDHHVPCSAGSHAERILSQGLPSLQRTLTTPGSPYKETALCIGIIGNAIKAGPVHADVAVSLNFPGGGRVVPGQTLRHLGGAAQRGTHRLVWGVRGTQWSFHDSKGYIDAVQSQNPGSSPLSNDLRRACTELGMGFDAPRHLYSHRLGTFLDALLDDADGVAKRQAQVARP